MKGDDAKEVILQLKQEADAIPYNRFAWRECGEALVNCTKHPSGQYQWRVIRDVDGPGRVITEAGACEILTTHSGWIGAQ